MGWSLNPFVRGVWLPRHVGVACSGGGDGGGRSDRQNHDGRLDMITKEKRGVVTELLRQRALTL